MLSESIMRLCLIWVSKGRKEKVEVCVCGGGVLKKERKQGEKLLASWGCLARLTPGLETVTLWRQKARTHLSTRALHLPCSHPPPSPTLKEGRQNGLKKKIFAIVCISSNS